MTDKKTGVSLSKLDRSTWQTVRLGDVCEIISGGTPATHVPEYWDGDIPWLSVVDFNTGNKYVTKTEKSISEAGLQNSSTHLLNTNEIIISARGTVGVLSILSKPMAFNQSCFGLCADSCVCDSDFLYYAMNASIAQMRQNSTMGVFSALTYQGLKSLSFLLPSHAMQKQISHSLSAIDAQISALRRLIAKQEAIKKATLKLLLELTVETRLVSIGEAFEISGGLSASRADLGNTGLCYLHYGDIHAANKTTVDTETDYSRIPKIDIPLSKVSSASLLEDGDVVFVDASEDDEGTSRYIVVRNAKKIPFVAGLHTIVAKQKAGLFDKGFLTHVFSSRFVKSQFVHYAVGTKVSGVNKKSIQNILVPCPPIERQEQIGKQLAAITAISFPLQAELVKAQDIKQGMMRYFFGD